MSPWVTTVTPGRRDIDVVPWGPMTRLAAAALLSLILMLYGDTWHTKGQNLKNARRYFGICGFFGRGFSGR
eukprot:1348744-Amorphochlora_amoeboformis.AAC.1